MRTFDAVIKDLTKILEEKQPDRFGALWIEKNALYVSRYIGYHIRSENGDIAWDRVTGALDKSFARRWTRYRNRVIKTYENQSQVDIIISKYKDNLYNFIACIDKSDEDRRDRMIISLVRLSQKGNTCAENEAVKWLTYITNDWLDCRYVLYRWQGYADEVEGYIRGCIRRYRYTGTFLGYLYKTLACGVRGKPPLVSLNDKIFDDKTREECTIIDEDWRLYEK